MVIRKEELITQDRPQLRGGEGVARLTALLSGDDLWARPSMFSLITLPAAASIGTHVHDTDSEVFYVLSGEGLYLDKGQWLAVKAGDLCLCRQGEEHGLKNASGQDLTVLAMIQKG